MAFEIRKISNVGVGHPAMARLCVQTTQLASFIGDKSLEGVINNLYITTLAPRLLRCHDARDRLFQALKDADSKVEKEKAEKGARGQMREVPHVIDLQGIAESFLYETKNYLRDLLTLFQAAYGCGLKDASAFTDLKEAGDSELVKWALKQFGADDSLFQLLKTEQEWVGELIRMRNAVEHPGGYSGTLVLQNIWVHRDHPDKFIPPTWVRGNRPESDMLSDMTAMLENLLTVAEDLLCEVIRRKAPFKQFAFYEIPAAQRDPKCPVRIRIGLSPELEASLGRGANSANHGQGGNETGKPNP